MTRALWQRNLIIFIFIALQAKALGKVLFEQVCRQLSLLEADYFGLEYQEQESKIKVKFFCKSSHNYKQNR